MPQSLSSGGSLGPGNEGTTPASPEGEVLWDRFTGLCRAGPNMSFSERGIWNSESKFAAQRT